MFGVAMNTTTIPLARHVIATLRAHEVELREAGIPHLSLSTFWPNLIRRQKWI